MDFDRLRFVSERADTSETTIAVQIPERAGTFIEFYRCIEPRNVTEFSYRFSDDPANIFMSFQAASDQDRQEVLQELESKGFLPLDLSQNEIAQTHLRYMIGGVAPSAATQEEALFSFQFPERPGSLKRFLEDLPPEFNVSLFHYRSHGADVARVLVALQVPVKQRDALRKYLEYLRSEGFTWNEETGNSAYHRFLLEPVVANSSGRSRPRTPPPMFLH